jgi:hypothetical protein
VNTGAGGIGFVLATFTMSNGSQNDLARTPDALPVVQSAFGDLQPYKQDYSRVSNAPYEKRDQTISWYGIACNLTRSHGTVNLTRASDRVRDWTVSSSMFTNASTDSPTAMTSFHKALFPYQSPFGSLSGFGTALGAYAQLGKGIAGAPNMTAYAHAFVQASGAIETSLLNSAVSNNSRVPLPVSYPLAGVETVLKYRMTYVPGILVFGLIDLTLCAAIVLGMTATAWNSMALRYMRLVDGLRFVVDFAETMRADEGLDDASAWSRARLERWADSIRLRYSVNATGDEIGEGTRRIKLVKKAWEGMIFASNASQIIDFAADTTATMHVILDRFTRISCALATRH